MTQHELQPASQSAANKARRGISKGTHQRLQANRLALVPLVCSLGTDRQARLFCHTKLHSRTISLFSDMISPDFQLNLEALESELEAHHHKKEMQPSMRVAGCLVQCADNAFAGTSQAGSRCLTAAIQLVGEHADPLTAIRWCLAVLRE
jgi:hypothetical protein